MYVASKSWVEINSAALRGNLEAIRRDVFPAQVMAVVKANAYGHGIEAVAACLKDLPDWYGVDCIEEAVVLRAHGVTRPVLVLGYVPEESVGQLFELDCTVTASTERFLECLAREAHARGVSMPVHLKWDTGLHRQGFDVANAAELAERWMFHPDVRIQGHCTHFAGSEDPRYEAFTQTQQALIEQAASFFTSPNEEKSAAQSSFVHSACTSAALAYPATRASLVRVGIGLYGYLSFSDTKEYTATPLKQVLTWKTRLVQIHAVPIGDTVGYDRTWTAARPSRVGLLPIGYWDGYSRSLSGVAYVLVCGVRVPVVGRICMNMCMIDLTDLPEVEVGQEVVLLGVQGSTCIDADELAGHSNTISYEFLTRINPLIPRIVQNP